jgi:GNAT superfamily N-acetyltransferase
MEQRSMLAELVPGDRPEFPRQREPSPPATVARLTDLPSTALSALVAESEQAGWRFVRRLADEWALGANRFDQPGEVLFAAWAEGRLVGVCGLNVDPYASDRRVRRVRRLYVLEEFRRRGVGRQLVQAGVAWARGSFAALRLRTESPPAAAFYERLGFRRQTAVADCTHALELTSDV